MGDPFAARHGIVIVPIETRHAIMIPEVIYPDWPLQDKVNAFTTLRLGGESLSPFEEFNLALHVGDQQSRVIANRNKLRAHFLLPNEPAWLQQVHGNKVLEINTTTSQNEPADASYTCEREIVCAVLTADCLPVFLSDEQGLCVGIAHAGWRGLLAGVIQNTIDAMESKATPTFAWLGPAIGPDAFEVGNDVYASYLQQDEAFNQAFTRKNSGKWNLDIYLAAKIVLRSADISRIYGGEYCTFTEASRFYSYRRQAKTGRMASLIWRK